MSASPTGRLYLVPLPLGSESDPREVLPQSTIAAAVRLRHFIAENARTARRTLARLPLVAPVQQVSFEELNEHTRPEALPALLAPLLAGEDVGLVSEAGCPAIADPGAALVEAAHASGIVVIPLVGPSSIVLALMASGLNGQAFTFHGYLPVNVVARAAKLTEIETASAANGAAQVFIETPYRNEALFATIVSVARPNTRLTIAADLTLPSEMIRSQTISQWRGKPSPTLASRPAIFALQAERPLSERASKPGRRS